MTATDRYGLPLSTTSSAARDAYVDAVDLLLASQAGAERRFGDALAADPTFALAAIGRGRVLAVCGRAAEACEAAALARKLAADATRREQQHVEALALTVEGRGADALAATRAHLMDFPRDAMVLAPAVGTVTGVIALSGRRDREAELLALLDALAPHYDDDWWFAAAHAFAMVEAGDADRGRPLVERALVLNRDNASAVHVYAHACYEQGDDAQAARYLDDWLPAYDYGGTLHCHLWWHVALFALARADLDGAWNAYTKWIAPGASWGPPQNTLTDGASFLWRAELAGAPRRPVEWAAMHDYARAAFPRVGVAFADVHVALAAAGAGDATALEALSAALREHEAAGRQAAGPVVAALAEAFGAFARGDYAAAIGRLSPLIGDHVRIGGSRAQRDLVEHTLLAAYLRAGRATDAEAMLARRPARRSLVPVAGLT
jgi:hypothetical protein